MSVSFLNASSQRLVNTSLPAGLATPFTVGCWANMTASPAIGDIWSLGHSVTTVNRLSLVANSTTQWAIAAQTGATSDTQVITASATVGTWQFLLGRFISATNRRLAVLCQTGEIKHAQGVTNLSPSLNQNMIGCRAVPTPGNFYEGLIGELWWAAGDIQADNAQLQDALMRQLAYGGPFSIPHIAPLVGEYMSLRTYPTSNGWGPEEYYTNGKVGRQNWTQVNSPTVAHHPPLPYWYKRPQPPGLIAKRSRLFLPDAATAAARNYAFIHG